jgi:hypothetical protein
MQTEAESFCVFTGEVLRRRLHENSPAEPREGPGEQRSAGVQRSVKIFFGLLQDETIYGKTVHFSDSDIIMSCCKAVRNPHGCIRSCPTVRIDSSAQTAPRK